MLLNEMYNTCAYLKAKFPQFEAVAMKIKTEKCFVTIPDTKPHAQYDKNNAINVNQMKSDELLTSMITTTEYKIPPLFFVSP